MSEVEIVELEEGFRELIAENKQLKIEVAQLKQQLELLQKLGRESSPPF
jgi:hypothetical protein